jgi:hypothetical protein
MGVIALNSSTGMAGASQENVKKGNVMFDDL